MSKAAGERAPGAVAHRAQLTQAEIDECKAMFEHAHKKTSGELDHGELQRVLGRMGQHPTEEELYQMIAEVDQQFSGSLKLPGFIKLIESQKARALSHRDGVDFTRAFVAVGGGHDGGGGVSVQELERVLNDEFELDAEVKKLVQRVHSGRITANTKISFDEFKAMLT
eukprot:g1138.t1